MTNGTRPDPYRLIADALASGSPSPELLAAYAEDPASLDAAERAQIERALATDPGLVAELEVLRRFDAGVLLGSEDGALAARPPVLRRRTLAVFLSAAAAVLVVYLASERGGNLEETARPSIQRQASAEPAHEVESPAPAPAPNRHGSPGPTRSPRRRRSRRLPERPNPPPLELRHRPRQRRSTRSACSWRWQCRPMPGRLGIASSSGRCRCSAISCDLAWWRSHRST
jgi:hypothetical protein